MTEQFNPLSLIQGADDAESFDIKSGGGLVLEPLPAGVTLQARLCGYVELGVHEDTNPQGQLRDKEEVRLFFQVWGKQLTQKDAEGNPIPRSVMLYINKSASDKGHWLKVFNILNHDGKRNNMAALLGAPCRVKLVAGTSKDPSKPAQARLRPDGITGPVVEVMDEDGNVTGSRVINPPTVDASEVKVFQFHKGTREQWDTLPYFLQEAIKEAKNIDQSPAKDFPLKEAPKNRQKAATPAVEDGLFGDDSL